jgi:phospholipase/lecithinase/hemolysin
MLRSMSRWTLFAFVLLASLAQAQGCKNRFVVFGDSLSDPGNFYRATGITSKTPFELIPSAPYEIGGHHFSNGKTWVEQLADQIGSHGSGAAALLNPGHSTNYAVGGARARPGASPTPYDLTAEVSLFLTDFGGHACSNATYVFWIGGDDLRDALEALPRSGQTGAALIIDQAINSIANNIVALWSAGARNFLILDAPDISNAPAVRAAGPAAVGAGAQLSAGFNLGLGKAIGSLQTLPQIQIMRFDDNALVDAIIATPTAFGLTDVRDTCLTFGVVANAICQIPESFLFWDGIHPTTDGHGIVAGAIRASDFP